MRDELAHHELIATLILSPASELSNNCVSIYLYSSGVVTVTMSTPVKYEHTCIIYLYLYHCIICRFRFRHAIPLKCSTLSSDLQNMLCLIESSMYVHLEQNDKKICCSRTFSDFHYNDVIMGAMSSQITSLTIVYSTVYSGRRRSKKTSKLRVTGLCEGNSPVTVTGEFPAQRASNEEKFDDVIMWSFEIYLHKTPLLIH